MNNQEHITANYSLFKEYNGVKLYIQKHSDTEAHKIDFEEIYQGSGEFSEILPKELDYSDIFYFNSWVFYRTKGSQNFNIFVFSETIIYKSIFDIESLILSEN